MTPTMPSATELLPLLPELVLVGAAFALLMLDLFLEERQRWITHALSIAALLVRRAMIALGMGGHGIVLNGMFVRDVAADVLKMFTCLISALSLVYAWPYLRERGLYKGEVPVLVLFATVGMMLMVSAGSLVMVYLGLEMLALCQYALVAIDRDGPLASEAAMKYFVLGALASGMLLYGLSLMYGATGTLDLQGIHAGMSHASPGLLLTGLVFIVAGIAFKFGAAPFHMWLPDVYHGAPTPITLFIGSAPKLAAFGMAYRLAGNRRRPARRTVAPAARRPGDALAGARQPDRAGADQPQAHAGVLDDLARRLPVPGLRRWRPAGLRGGDVLRDHLRDHVGRGLRRDHRDVQPRLRVRRTSTTSRASTPATRGWPAWCCA
jgi:NADH:ubiquinone oxidoreductase subunit 2 (subunit N)